MEISKAELRLKSLPRLAIFTHLVYIFLFNPIYLCIYFQILILVTHLLVAAADRLKHVLEKSEAPVPVFVITTNTTVITLWDRPYMFMENLGLRSINKK